MDDVVAFLSSHPPFCRLPAEVVAETARVVEIARYPRGRTILALGGEPARSLYVIRSGAVDLLRDTSTEADVVDTLGAGETFAHPSLVSGGAPILAVRAREETVAYLIPKAQFERLRTHPAFEAHFVAALWQRLERALRLPRERTPLDLFGTRCGDLVRRPPVTCRPDEPIVEVARRMADERVSSIIVTSTPVGILTDRDLRSRVLGGHIPIEAPVARAMSAPAITLPAASLLFEAMLVMVERSIHHLPLTAGGRIVGVITDTDLLRHQSNSPVFLRRQLDRARTPADFAEYASLVTASVEALLAANARPTDIGRVVAVAHDALIRRVLRDVEGELGPPPVPYAFLVSGSAGRQEQVLRTDRDDALVWADPGPADAAAVADYFARLAAGVAARLAAAGFPPCRDGFAAEHPAGRGPLGTWRQRTIGWIERPDPLSLPRLGLVADGRAVHGALDVAAEVRPIFAEARRSGWLLALLAGSALRARPPLGLFGQFTLERRGPHRDALDIKRRGIAPIVHLARLAALEQGSPELGTLARLRAGAGCDWLSPGAAEDLVAAFEALSVVRLRHQLDQLRRGESPDDWIRPGDLSGAERRDLKDAFGAVERVQRAVELYYHPPLHE